MGVALSVSRPRHGHRRQLTKHLRPAGFTCLRLLLSPTVQGAKLLECECLSSNHTVTVEHQGRGISDVVRLAASPAYLLTWIATVVIVYPVDQINDRIFRTPRRSCMRACTRPGLAAPTLKPRCRRAVVWGLRGKPATCF
jgi:hypothetical protein